MCTNVADKLASIISFDDGGSMFIWTTSVHFYHTTKHHNPEQSRQQTHCLSKYCSASSEITIQHQLSELIGTEEV